MKFIIPTILIASTLTLWLGCGSANKKDDTETPTSCPLSWYDPGNGTQDQGVCLMSGPVIASGENTGRDILIMESFGSAISRVSGDNKHVWRTPVTGGVHGNFVALTDEYVEVEMGRNLIRLDLETGEILSETTIEKKRVIQSTGDYATFDNHGPATFPDGFTPDDDLQHPRSVDSDGQGTYALADTFGFRVIIYSQDYGRHEFWEHFPNQVQILSPSEVLVTGEHTNRLYIYNLATKEKHMVLVCPEGPYSDPDLTAEEVSQYEHSVPPGLAPCRGQAPYSPNGADMLPSGVFAIADTDNHRVLEYDETGYLLRSIYNLNAPTKVLFLEDSENGN